MRQSTVLSYATQNAMTCAKWGMEVCYLERSVLTLGSHITSALPFYGRIQLEATKIRDTF